MLNDSLLDKIFPIPKLEDLKAEKVEQLKQEGFVITNFESGGIFNMLLMIVLQVRIELLKLLFDTVSIICIPCKWYLAAATGEGLLKRIKKSNKNLWRSYYYQGYSGRGQYFDNSGEHHF